MIDDIGFIGGGNMAAAIIGALRGTGSVARVRVVDPDPAAAVRLAPAGAEVSADPALLVGVPVVVLAVKPQVLGDIAGVLAGYDTPERLLISILAGVTTDRLERLLPKGCRVVRAMPNTPLAVGRGMTGICVGSRAGTVDLSFARELFAGGGEVVELEEGMMDALTAVSGSGPAYCFYVAEALVGAAVALGFDRQTAAQLVGQTLEGAVAYLRSQPGFPAAELSRQVTSKGGTTAAALAVLEEAGVGERFTLALRAAAARAAELSRN